MDKNFASRKVFLGCEDFGDEVVGTTSARKSCADDIVYSIDHHLITDPKTYLLDYHSRLIVQVIHVIVFLHHSVEIL